MALSLALGLNRTAPGRIGRLVLMNSPAYPQPVPFKQKFLTWPVVPYVALAAIPPIFTAAENGDSHLFPQRQFLSRGLAEKVAVPIFVSPFSVLRCRDKLRAGLPACALGAG